ncbi:hypothetical protein SFUMM280S_07028 [Streptomyces fumanus]
MQAGGVGDGEFGVAAGGEAEVGDDALAEPVARGARAEGVDHARDLAAGDGGQDRRRGGRALVALAQGGVQQVDARRAGASVLVDVDLRGAAPLEIARGVDRLAGAVISPAQLLGLAPVLAAELGVRVVA